MTKDKTETHHDVIYVLGGKILICECQLGASHSIKIRGVCPCPIRICREWCEKFNVPEEGFDNQLDKFGMDSLSAFRKNDVQLFLIDDSSRDGGHDRYLDNEFSRLRVIAC
jgi:hypothetical protein